MMLGSHAGPLVRAEGREHLVTARGAPPEALRWVRILVGQCGSEDFIHHVGNRVPAEADVDPESRGVPPALPLDELDDRRGAVPVVEPVRSTARPKPVELEAFAESGRQAAGPPATPKGFQERGVIHPARPVRVALCIDLWKEGIVPRRLALAAV